VSDRLRPAAFALLAAALLLAASYVLFELAVQALARGGVIREYADYRYFERHVLDAVTSEGGHPLAPVDPELGWMQPTIALGAQAGTGGGAPPTILFLGDSVTFGDAAVRGENDYVTRVARAMAPEGVRVVNAASSGYGVDQMMLRLERELPTWSPGLVVVAWIPHDLLRVGRSRFIRLTKPSVDVAGAALRVEPPQDLHAWYAEQARALATFRYGAWLAGERWAQRRAEAPGFYLDWYAAVLERIAARMGARARDAGARLVFFEIPNHADPDALALLAPVMRRVLAAGEAAGLYHTATFEPCLRARAAPAEWPTPAFTAAHPGPDGHADLAACVLSEVVRPHRAAVLQSAGVEAPRAQPESTTHCTIRSARSPNTGCGSSMAASARAFAASSGVMPASSARASSRRVVQ